MYSKPNHNKNTRSQNKKNYFSFLFDYNPQKKETSTFLLKEKEEPRTKDDDFLVLGREEFCLEYSSGELSRMSPETVQENSLKYQQSRNFLADFQVRSVKLD